MASSVSSTVMEPSWISNRSSPPRGEDKSRLEKVQQAVQLIDKLEAQQNLYDTCNMYFSSLPRGKSLRELWQSGDIWLNFWPNSPKGEFGVTHRNSKDITLASWCLDTQTTAMIAATIIHETAHIAGAPALARTSRSALF